MPIALEAVIRAAMLLLVLLNPFLLSVYLRDLFRHLDFSVFVRVMLRAAAISGVVFILFAWLGDRIFTDVLQVRFASFMIFGGIVFLIIAIRFITSGAETIIALRGEPEHLAGAIAMPFMIGPGTINASVIIGGRLSLPGAMLAICGALLITALTVIGLKLLHDVVQRRNESIVNRYVDLCGRVSALVIGALAVEMILQGVDAWLDLPAATG